MQKSRDERTSVGVRRCTSSLDLGRKNQFNEPLLVVEPLPVVPIEVAPCVCSASTEPEPLLETLRLAVEGTGFVAFAGALAGAFAGAAPVLAVVGDFVGAFATGPAAGDIA